MQTRDVHGQKMPKNANVICERSLTETQIILALSVDTAKGQLISKCLFWCLQFSQKTNKNNSTWGTIVVKSFFYHFLGELKIPKIHFEINWPLKKYLSGISVHYLCVIYHSAVGRYLLNVVLEVRMISIIKNFTSCYI